jgi:hypothetical protein
MKAKQIIQEIREQGGLDLNFMERTAKLDGLSLRDYVTGWVKEYYDCHGNTARVVANHFI